MSKNAKIIVTVIVLAILGLGAYTVMTTPEDRSFGEKIEDAGDSLSEGVDDAARQLEDRSPAEKVEDAVDDATDGDAE